MKAIGGNVSITGMRRVYRLAAALSMLTSASLWIAQEVSSARGAEATAVFAGGCFWGIEAVFEHVRGVESVVSGYARRGDADQSSRQEVATEAVRITYDPAAVSFEQLLDVFFAVAHDPISRDRQGPDQGPEYRAVVYYQDAGQRALTDAHIAALVHSQRFSRPIVTEVRPLGGFRVAEPFHQNYAALHPTEPYIVQNDLPKLRRLQQQFPTLYQKKRAP
jgi:peptide-methionine (S)-S-oxide reductase